MDYHAELQRDSERSAVDKTRSRYYSEGRGVAKLTAIHAPTDPSLLWDAVRVMVRLLRQAAIVRPDLAWRDHTAVAKKRARAIEYGRGSHRQRLYRELFAKTRATLAAPHRRSVRGARSA